MKRGDIYFIHRHKTTGHEIAKARPAIIVSNNTLNNSSEVVEVVYLTTKPKKELPTHVEINATGVRSIACCEQISSVSTELLGDFYGTCSTEEMQALDAALLASLGIEVEEGIEIEESIELSVNPVELAKIIAERDIYKHLVDRMLRQGVMGV